MPQEETLEVKRSKGELLIGIPKETHYQEKRVCLTPDAVAALIAHGHKFIIETGAGDGANYTDREYSEAVWLIETFRSDVCKCDLTFPAHLQSEPSIF